MRRRCARRIRWRLARILPVGVPALLIRSNQLALLGNHAEAADGLEELARAAAAGRGRPGSTWRQAARGCWRAKRKPA